MFNWFCVTSKKENAGESWAGTRTGGSPRRTGKVKNWGRAEKTWRTTSGY